MDAHPGPEKRRVPAGKLAEFEPIRRALQDNEDWYEDLVEHSHDLLCVHDLGGRLLAINPAPARLLGYSVEEILQIPMRDLIPAESRDQFNAYLEEIERAGEARGFLTVMTRSGERRTWEFHNTLRTEGVESPVVRGIAHDVTEQRETEKRLREVSEQLLSKVREGESRIRELKLFRTLVDQCNDAIEVVDPETLRFLDVNEMACSALGYSREELLSMKVFDIDPAVTESSIGAIRERWRRPGWMVLESVHRRKDGSTFPVEVNTRQVHLERDYIVAIVRDVSDRKQAERRLEEYERVVEGMEEMIVVMDRDYRYLIANRAALNYRGLKKGQMVGRSFGELLAAEGASAPMIDLARLKIAESFQGGVVQYELKDNNPSLGERDLHLSYFPIEGPMGVDRIACVVRDVTERKQAEEALRRSEESYRIFVSQSSEGIFREDPDAPIPVNLPEDELIRHILYDHSLAECNDALAAMYGFTSGRELLGKRLTEMVVPDDPRNIELTREYIRSGFRVINRESHEVDIHGNPKIFLNSMIGIVENGMLVRTWGIQRDITEQVKLEEARGRTEEALRQSEERLRIALSGSPIKVFNQDRDLRYTWVYNLQEGWTEQDYLGKTDEEIFGPETGAKMEAIKRPVLETGRGTRQEFSLTADGKTYHCDITVEPLKDAAGRVVGVNCACIDITHLREVTEELRLAKEKLSEEKLYLEEAIDTELGFGEIIGTSSALKEVMKKVAKVAPSDATVLLLGETGTGKELVARAVHRTSLREGNSFIKVNCAAIPSGLLESELFGHEKGSFTGAVARKLGRLELADHGTLFLDEIGEIPLGLQPKLLRVLQDQEFERLGGTQTLKVNFRLLAATNRDLLQGVKAHEFRSDLYYRLNVFPILIPPLRERREDIRPLAEHFVRKFAAQTKKSITSIPSKAMEILVRWDWPGNIRELENFMERSVILTPGSVLQAPLSELEGATTTDKSHGGSTGHLRDNLRDKERERILRVLRDCHGRLGGPDGAAARLGLKRTTLQSKLDLLGIKPGTFRE
jgi:PAS domain S-box-containing protein